jgi:hypothetical protein
MILKRRSKMKIRYLIIFLILGIFISEAQAMSPKKGGAAGIQAIGTKCGGKKLTDLKCTFSRTSNSDWGREGSCDTKDAPIKIKAGAETIGELGVELVLYKGSADSSLNSEYCVNIITTLHATKKKPDDRAEERFIPHPDDPLTLKVFIFSGTEDKPIFSEAVKIKIDKNRVMETITEAGLKNGYNINFNLPPGKPITSIRSSLLPTTTGKTLSSKGF